MQDRYFSDEELVAYLDGETDFSPVDAIAAAVKTDIALAKRLEALRVDTGAISAGFDELLDPQRPRPALPSSAQPKTPWRQVAAAAMVALTLGSAIGLGSGYLAFTQKPPGWKDYVAAYQALYTNSTLNHIELDAAAAQKQLTRVSAAIGKDIKVASLSDLAEVDYKRAQILGFKGKAIIQLAFLSSTGEPVALCILRSDKQGKSTVAMSRLEGLSTASWVNQGYSYLLIGGTDDSLVSRLAAKFADAEI